MVKVRVGDIVHDHADCAALPGSDGPGLEVGRVPELGDRLMRPADPSAGRLCAVRR